MELYRRLPQVLRMPLLGGGLLLYVATLAWACPDKIEAARGDSLGVPHSITPRGGPDTVGQWSAPEIWPAIAIHAALMPTGEVLHYSYPDNSQGSRAITWNPISGIFNDVDFSTDIWCGGLVNLPDGKIFVMGGNNSQCLFQGRRGTQTFDPFTQVWQTTGVMATGRWYPNAIQLGDGRVMITSGLDTNCQSTDIMEIYTPGVGLEVIPGGTKELALFPQTHLLTSGLVAHVGSEELTSTFDPVTETWAPVDFSSGYRASGTSVLIPGALDKVMLIGGYINGQAAASCEIIDFNDTESGYQDTDSLNFGRAHHNPVILPDKTVLVIGGGTNSLYGNPRMNPELYDPATGTWSVMAAQTHARMYHSTALLLPDGRVIAAGQDSGDSAYNNEVYEPPYLFRSDRPVITSVPAQLGYGYDYILETPDASEIDSVALLAMGTQTHSVSTNMRYVGLEFVTDGENELVVSAPVGATYAPRGYYMLFIVLADGTPSVASIVQVGDFEPPTACEGDANGDGLVDPLDAGYIQARFGCSVGEGDSECDAADVNSDVLVDPLDVGYVLARFGACE